MPRAKAKIVATWPIIDGKVHPDVSQTIRFLRDDIGVLRSKVVNLDAGKVGVDQLPSQLVTHAPTIRASLQAGGNAPLNVNSLFGVLTQPQTPAVPKASPPGTPLPSITSPLSVDGVLINHVGALYRYNEPTKTWEAQVAEAIFFQGLHSDRLLISAADLPVGFVMHETDRNAYYEVELVAGVNQWVWTFGAMAGTFAPDQRPIDLGLNDAGFIFFATDTVVTWRWSGAAWVLISSGGGGTVNFADSETPVDSGDHQHFTLANAPSPAASLELFLVGTGYPSQFLFPAGGDYTLAGNAFVLNAALVGSFTMLAYYRY